MAAEAAAEAIWSLSFDSAANQAAFVQQGALEALSSTVSASRLYPTVAIPARCVMWAAAALHALCASYCTTPRRLCRWTWEQGRILTPAAAVSVDGEQARERTVSQPQLIASLVDHACAGPVDAAPSAERPWPSNTHVGNRLAYSILPWAAAAALGSLALSPTGQEAILRGAEGTRALDCLCRLSRSPDHLERQHALAAVETLAPLIGSTAAARCNQEHSHVHESAGLVHVPLESVYTQYS